jgi:hypothetical protein
MLRNYRFEKIKKMVETKEYISRFVKLKKTGQIYKGVCPFHNEKTPSFSVYPAGTKKNNETQEHASFYCFGCGAAGDLFEFRKKIEHLNTKWNALELFEKELGIEILDEDEEAQNQLREQLQSMKNIQATTLSLSEINLICSSMCRDYLVWVKETYPDKHEEEKCIIDKYFLYFDKFFNEKSAIEAQHMVDEIEKKLNKRRISL